MKALARGGVSGNLQVTVVNEPRGVKQVAP